MFLVVREGQEVGRAYKLQPGNTIAGRNPTCQIAMPDDAAVSRQHTRFTFKPDGGCSATDLNSTNGTFVNGKRLPPSVSVLIEPGAALRIGATVFELVKNYVPARVPRPARPEQAQELEMEEMLRRSEDTDSRLSARAAKIMTDQLPEGTNPVPEAARRNSKK